MAIWERRKILIWGKTRPELSKSHKETVCTGGVFEDTKQFVRLYPIAALHVNGDVLHRIVGPAARQGDGWVLPVFDTALDSDAKLEAYTREAAKLRRAFGLDVAAV